MRVAGVGNDVICSESNGSNNFFSDTQLSKKAEQLTKLSPAFLQEAQQAAKELAALAIDGGRILGQEYRTDVSRPELPVPRKWSARVANDAQSESAKVGVRLAAMMAALESGNLTKLASKANTFLFQQEMLNNTRKEIAAKYDAALQEVEHAIADLEIVSGKLEGLIDDIDGLKKQLTEVERILSSTEPGTPEYDAALQNRNVLQATFDKKQGQLTEVKEGVALSEVALEGKQAQVDVVLARSESAEINLPKSLVKKDQSHIERMLVLMTKLGELMLKTGEVRTETQRALLRIQEDIRNKKMIADAKKADIEREKAEALNKTMGCVGKILGAVILAVSVIGAIFTGGASLALAGIGVALMVADEVYTAVTGESFMQKVMQPLMKILQPVLQAFMNKISEILARYGVDPQTSKMVSMVVVSVAIAAAVVGLAVTGVGGAVASAVSNITSKITSVMSRVLEKTLGKLVPAMVKKAMSQVIKQTSGAASRMFDAASKRLGLSTDLASKQIYASRMAQLGAGVNFGKTVITNGLDVGVEVANLNTAKVSASIQLSVKELTLLNDMISTLLDQFKNSLDISQKFFTAASNAINHHASTGVALARAMRSAHSA